MEKEVINTRSIYTNYPTNFISRKNCFRPLEEVKYTKIGKTKIIWLKLQNIPL